MKNSKFIASRSIKRYKILFVLAILLSSLSAFAEENPDYVEAKTFTFSFENVPLKKVIDYIEKNSEYIFVYYGETIDPNRKVSISNQSTYPSRTRQVTERYVGGIYDRQQANYS